MIQTITGIILLLIPFLLINKFENKKKGFYFILFGILACQFLIGFLTQLLGIFNYLNIIIINLFIGAAVVFKTDFKKLRENIKKIKIDWVLILLILTISISLYGVHHNYTGEITTINNPFLEVENFKYNYPFFSDEWIGISLTDYSIESGKLPFVNTLWYNTKFANLGFASHSFGAEILLLLGLAPLKNYIWLSFFNTLIICLLVYFILKENKVSRFSSFIASVCLLYITRGANLPGLWTFIPLTGGMTFLLFSILFLSIKNSKSALFCGFLTLLFYPPLGLFLVPMIFAYYFIYNQKDIKYVGYLALIILSAAVFLIILSRYFGTSSVLGLLNYLPSKFFYETFTKNAIPDFSIWKVIFPLILVFSLVGIITSFKKMFHLIVPIFVGLAYWILYSRVLWRLIIEYERSVITTSILLIIFAGFGIDYVLGRIKEFFEVKNLKVLKIAKIIIILLLFGMSFFYTQLNNWQDLKLHTADGKRISPAAPANSYMQEDDLKLFNFTGKTFITAPWKGLVIASATGNYPLHSKPSTLTESRYNYFQFIGLNCAQMQDVSIQKKIEYVYAQKDINCTGFNRLGRSQEGFVLYEVKV